MQRVKDENDLKNSWFQFMKIILEEMFEITYEAYHYEIGIDCLNVTFLSTVNGTPSAL